MIEVSVKLDSGGRLLSLEASGHSQCGYRGADPVCAGFSSLVRSVAKTVESGPVTVEGGASAPGELFLSLRECSGSELWLSGVTAVLMTGLRELASDYPDAVALNVTIEEG